MQCDPRCDFAGSYELSTLPAVKAVERSALGCDYGGTSWTTAAQVPHIVSSLRLEAGTRLLEAGSGAGWPGLYLSRNSGCAVTLLDIPLNALRLAAGRAAEDGIGERVDVVNGNATALPFTAAAFDCVSHSDVLCCLPEKREMLEECRRIVHGDGRMHFSVIEAAGGLDPASLARVREAGPPFVETNAPYAELLPRTGWRLVEHVDITSEFGDTLERFVAGLEAGANALTDAFGAGAFAEAVARRKEQIRIVRARSLLRSVYVAAAA